MKIGIISDSHENMNAIREAVRIFNQEKIEMLFHAGDIISPITYKEFEKLNCPIIITFGNNDGERKYLPKKFEKIARFYDIYKGEAGGRKILMMHMPDLVNEVAKSGEFDIIIYGHTHKTDIRKINSTLIINPGESGSWLYGKKTIVILETSDLTYNIIDLPN